MTTLALYNLGCSKNIVDGESIAGFLESRGFELVEDFATAQVIIVNTCAFIREAKEEAIDAILSMAAWKKQGSCHTLVVAGCFAQRYRDSVATRFPEVDLWTGVEDWHTQLESHFRLRPAVVLPVRHLTGLKGTQYIKIAEGCSHQCSYCAIPAIRGPFHSRPAAEIIAEARWLEQQGVLECILVAQDSSHWGHDFGQSLTDLVRQLLDTTSFPWIRLMYLHPQRISDELLELFAREQRLCPYFDIPLQHVSKPILAAMKRGGSAAGLRRLIERIRTRCSQAALRTSFILGFPGETDRHVAELIEFIEWARFDKIGVFPFSPEDGTAAFTLRPRPRSTTVQRRCEEVMSVQREISAQICQSRIGQSVPVIIDAVSSEPGYAFEGRTRWDAPEVDGQVFIDASGLQPGTLVDLTITGADEYDLFARPDS